MSLRELWDHRDLLFFLVLRELKSSTRNSRLGLGWLVLHPLALAAVLAVVLGMFIRVPAGDLPYILVVFSGFLPWSYISNAVTRASNSMSASSYLLTKVYFPRLIIPTVPILSRLVELVVFLIVLVGTAIYFGIPPQWTWLLLFASAALSVGFAIGAGLWLSALTVRVRDIAHAVPVFLQIGTYVSPVLYPVNFVPEKWRWAYEMNPIVGIIELSRWSLIPTTAFPARPIYVSLAGIALLICTGLFYFRATEDEASDIV